MVINNHTRSTNITDRVFWYRASHNDINQLVCNGLFPELEDDISFDECESLSDAPSNDNESNSSVIHDIVSNVSQSNEIISQLNEIIS